MNRQFAFDRAHMIAVMTQSRATTRSKARKIIDVTLRLSCPVIGGAHQPAGVRSANEFRLYSRSQPATLGARKSNNSPCVRWPTEAINRTKGIPMMTSAPVKDIAQGVTVAAAMFAGLGAVAALWENPLFMNIMNRCASIWRPVASWSWPSQSGSS